jgi:hypothetical protein
MERTFVFVGDPGPDAPRMLGILTAAQVKPRRCPPDSEAAEIEAACPVAIAFASDVPHRDQRIVALRERAALHRVPILTRVRSRDDAEVQQVFKEGADGFLLDGEPEHFDALVAALVNEDSWQTVRAPAGRVILAHPDRPSRVRIARVLRRNGFDPHFAATAHELTAAIAEVETRAVVASTTLPGPPLVASLVGGGRAADGSPPAWLVLAPHQDLDGLQGALSAHAACRLADEEADPEASTFLLNELLLPEQPKQRRSPRLLYGAMVSFGPEGSGATPFSGFTYNVNAGGLFIRTLTPLPLQSRLSIAFTPPFGRGTVCFMVQVVWRKEFGDEAGAATPPGMGVQIVDAWPADLKGFEAGYQVLCERSNSGRTALGSLPPQSAAPHAAP